METLTKELKTFITEKNINKLVYDDILKDIGLINCKNIQDNSIKVNNNEIIFSKENIHSFCQKYNLIWGNMNKFIDLIPKANIQAIKNYLLKYPALDRIRVSEMSWGVGKLLDVKDSGERVIKNFKPHFFSFFDFDNVNNEEFFQKYGTLIYNGKKYKGWFSIEYNTDKNRSFSIVAPESYFNLKNSKVINNEIIEDDPVIFERIEENQYRVVTSWGKEQLTEELQNPILN